MAGHEAFLEALRQEVVEIIRGNPGSTGRPPVDARAGQETVRYILALQIEAAADLIGCRVYTERPA